MPNLGAIIIGTKVSYNAIQERTSGIAEPKGRRTLEDLSIGIVKKESTSVKNSKLYSLNSEFLENMQVFI